MHKTEFFSEYVCHLCQYVSIDPHPYPLCKVYCTSIIVWKLFSLTLAEESTMIWRSSFAELVHDSLQAPKWKAYLSNDKSLCTVHIPIVHDRIYNSVADYISSRVDVGCMLDVCWMSPILFFFTIG